MKVHELKAALEAALTALSFEDPNTETGLWVSSGDTEPAVFWDEVHKNLIVEGSEP